MLVQAWRRAPDAAFMYAGVYPKARGCISGEDLPGNYAVLRNGRVAYLSTRNLVAGRPPAELMAPDAPAFAAWDWGESGACLNGAPESLPPPFSWPNMFSGGGHPGGMASYGLVLMMAATVVEAWEALARERWAAPAPTPLPTPLHDGGGHGLPCRGGVAFECRTLLSPSFGKPLRPLPSGCAVTWRAPRAPDFDAASCGDVWGGALDATAIPAGWALTEMNDFRHEMKGSVSVRKDAKVFLVAQQSGARARFPVRVGARGQVGIAYFTGQEFGDAMFELLCGDGAVRCDPGAAPFRLSAHGAQYVTRTAIIGAGLAPGDYVLEVDSEPGLINVVAVAAA